MPTREGAVADEDANGEDDQRQRQRAGDQQCFASLGLLRWPRISGLVVAAVVALGADLVGVATETVGVAVSVGGRLRLRIRGPRILLGWSGLAVPAWLWLSGWLLGWLARVVFGWSGLAVPAWLWLPGWLLGLGWPRGGVRRLCWLLRGVVFPGGLLPLGPGRANGPLTCFGTLQRLSGLGTAHWRFTRLLRCGRVRLVGGRR